MDFKHQIAAPAGLADVDVDALVLVVGDRPDPALAPPLATAALNDFGEASPATLTTTRRCVTPAG